VIPVHEKDGATRIAHTYNGLTLNNPADPLNDIYELDAVAINDQWDALSEPKVQKHGIEVHEPRKVVAMIRGDGVIRAPSFGKLYDKVLALNEAFDMVNAYTADSATVHNRGFLPYAFSIPTADITNYPSGLISAKYMVHALQKPVSRTSQFEGQTCRYTLLLQAADPRLYYTVAQSVNRSNAGTMNAVNTLARFPSPVTSLEIALTGSGSGRTSFEMGGKTLVLDLTGLTGSNTIVVDMEYQTIKLNGADSMSKYYSGDFWKDLPKGATTVITIANLTGTLAATVTASWQRAL